jgi:Zn-dependent protease/predicted transcriptional regulator
MRWSLRLGRWAGVDVYVHATFSLLLIWVGMAVWLSTHNVVATLTEVVFVLCIFMCVLLHEFGHALTARGYGIRTRDITLLPIGGMARLERIPEKPSQEFWVALAGPAVNLVIAGVLLAGLVLLGQVESLAKMSFLKGTFVERLIMVNAFILLFNLLPAFPMDGGRVLRAFLASRMPYVQATHIAASIGQGMAFLFGFLGFAMGHLILLLIAFFVWIGASQESGAVELRVGLRGVRVEDAMITEFHTLDRGDSLARAVELILAGSQHDFPVIQDGQVLGVLTRRQLMMALAKEGRDRPATNFMKEKVPILQAGQLVMDVMSQLQDSDCQTLPVMKDGRLVGLLTSENIGELLMIRSALKTATG